MPQTTPAPASPKERLAARICRLTNAKGGLDPAPAITELRRRMKAETVDAALAVAIKRGWMRRAGGAFVITPAGAELGTSRSGTRSQRVMPF